MSHDLRTPLSIATMTLEMLRQVKDLSPETIELVIDRGLRATNAIERLAKSVLDVVKAENGEGIKVTATESAENIVQDIVNLTLPLAEKKSVQLRAQLRAPGKRVHCQKTHIEQVVGNLISNALKFTPEGGSITVSVEQEQAQIVFCVADTGGGIHSDHLERIFERFWQEDHAREQGTGLGLAIAKEIVEQEGGKIWAKSTPGRGSSFFFSLPCADGQ
ncbi:MAG: HAMP domain-containing histidine kinase, partial [Sphingobacteriales bacterium]